MQTATENHKEVNKNKNLFLKTRHIYRNWFQNSTVKKCIVKISPTIMIDWQPNKSGKSDKH